MEKRFIKEKFAILALIHKKMDELYDEVERAEYIYMRVIKMYDFYIHQKRMIEGLNPDRWKTSSVCWWILGLL